MKEVISSREAEHEPLALASIEAEAAAAQAQIDQCLSFGKQRVLADKLVADLNQRLQEWNDGEQDTVIIVAGRHWEPGRDDEGNYKADIEVLSEEPIQGRFLCYQTYEYDMLSHKKAVAIGRRVELDAYLHEGRTFSREEQFFALAPIATSTILTTETSIPARHADLTPKDSVQRDIMRIFHRYDDTDGAGFDLIALTEYFADLRQKDPSGEVSNDFEQYVEYLNKISCIEGQEVRVKATDFYEYSEDGQLICSGSSDVQGFALGFLSFRQADSQQELSLALRIDDDDGTDALLVTPLKNISRLKVV